MISHRHRFGAGHVNHHFSTLRQGKFGHYGRACIDMDQLWRGTHSGAVSIIGSMPWPRTGPGKHLYRWFWPIGSRPDPAGSVRRSRLSARRWDRRAYRGRENGAGVATSGRPTGRRFPPRISRRSVLLPDGDIGSSASREEFGHEHGSGIVAISAIGATQDSSSCVRHSHAESPGWGSVGRSTAETSDKTEMLSCRPMMSANTEPQGVCMRPRGLPPDHNATTHQRRLPRNRIPDLLSPVSASRSAKFFT
jgi:hypothetical protein